MQPPLSGKLTESTGTGAVGTGTASIGPKDDDGRHNVPEDSAVIGGPGDALTSRNAAEVDQLKALYRRMAEISGNQSSSSQSPSVLIHPDLIALAAASGGCLVAEPASLLVMGKATELYIKRLLEELPQQDLIMAADDRAAVGNTDS